MSQHENEKPREESGREQRKFFVSANRGQASHRIRYVESGGAAVDTEECTFCQSVPTASTEGSKSE